MRLPVTHALQRRVGLCFTWILAAVCLVKPPVSDAQTYTPLSSFAALPTSSLTRVHIKLTVEDPGMSLAPSIIVSTDSISVDPAVFTPFRRPGFDYSFDDYLVPQEEPGGFRAPIVRPMTMGECAVLLDALAALPGVADGGMDVDRHISLSILRADVQPVECFETVLGPANIASALSAMKTALPSSHSARLELEKLGCGFQYFSTQTPTLLSNSVVRVEFSGARRAPQLGDNMFRCRVRVRNISNQTLAAPLRLVLSTSASLATIYPVWGYTCRTDPQYSSVFPLPIGSGLAKNAVVELDLVIDNPGLEKLDMSYVLPDGGGAYPRVFQGAGDL